MAAAAAESAAASAARAAAAIPPAADAARAVPAAAAVPLMAGLVPRRAVIRAAARRLAGMVRADVVVGRGREIGRHAAHGDGARPAASVDPDCLPGVLADRLGAAARRDVDGTLEHPEGGAAVGTDGQDELGPA